MWTRVPPFTSCCDHSLLVPSCALALDHQEAAKAELEAFSQVLRLHHNHQPGEQEQVEYYTANCTKHTLATLDYVYFPFSTFKLTTLIHHDLPEAGGAFKRLPTEGFIAKESKFSKLSHMSTPEGVARRVRQQPQLQFLPETVSCSCERQLVGSTSISATEEEKRTQLDDMQTQFLLNAKHTLLNADASSSDQEVPELVVPSKKRRIAIMHNEFIITPKDLIPHSLDQACEDHSGRVSADQHCMADLDSSSKASTPEDIDSQVPAASFEAAKPYQFAAVTVPECSSTLTGKQQVVEQEVTHDESKNVESQSQVILEQPRRLDPHPSDDDTQSTSQIRFWVPQSSPSRYPTSKTMAGHGSEEWLQLSLGSSGVQSEETQPEDQPDQVLPESPTHIINPPTSTDPPQGSTIVKDFFKFGSETEAAHHGSTVYTSSPVTPRHRQHYSGSTPESSSHRSGGTLSRPLTFLEPRPRSSRDSPWVDPNVIPPRVPSGGNVVEGQFLSPSPVLQQRPPAFSNLASLPYYPARVLQPVRSEQTETTSIHASPWMGVGMGMGMQQQQHPHREAPPRTPPNPAEFLSMATPGAFRDWRSAGSPGYSGFLTMQPPQMAQPGVDPEQAWRNLLQRVGSNLTVPSGFGGAGASSSSSAGRGDAMMLPPGEREEYLDALTRAVERFQGTDQGGRDEPLTELQRLQRNAMLQRPHLGPFDPSTDISLAGYLNTPSSSGSKSRAPAPALSSDRQRRVLRPHAPRPGLWFTLQASNSQPEASPLQQIPTAYIRVVDGNMTVAAVRRYLVNKLELGSEDEVELTCKGVPLQPSMPLSQVRDGIWQSPNTNTPNLSTPQLLSEGKAWKARDGSIILVGDVVMVITYGRRPQAPPPPTSA